MGGKLPRREGSGSVRTSWLQSALTFRAVATIGFAQFARERGLADYTSFPPPPAAPVWGSVSSLLRGPPPRYCRTPAWLRGEAGVR